MELPRYLVRPELWERIPADWAEVFGRDGPLGVEIGFGNGEYLAAAAREHPDWNWVGFETSLTCVAKACGKLAQAGAEHVRVALLDGRFALRELFPDESVARAVVRFPCPWPKRSHAHRRLVEGEFPRTVAAVLSPGGEFDLTTDVLPYARAAADELSSAGFTLTGPDELDTSSPASRYEAKWREQGRRIWRLVARRGPKGSTLRIAEGPMPHVRVPKRVRPEEVGGLVGLKASWPEGAFVIKEVFLSPGGAALLRAFATDRGFEQHYFLAVVPDGEGTLVKLDGATVPFRTPAVKRSVAAAAAALEGR